MSEGHDSGVLIDGDSKIRLANLVTTVCAAVTITTILVGMRGDITGLTKAVDELVEVTRTHNKEIAANGRRLDTLEWRSNNK